MDFILESRMRLILKQRDVQISLSMRPRRLDALLHVCGLFTHLDVLCRHFTIRDIATSFVLIVRCEIDSKRVFLMVLMWDIIGMDISK